MTTIYDQALQAINGGHCTAKLYSDKTMSVFLRRSNGNAFLVYQKLDTRGLVEKCEQVRCATYMQNRGGFIFTLDRDTYARWVAKTGHKVQPKIKLQTLAEFAETPGGQGYMDLLPDKDVLTELRTARMI